MSAHAVVTYATLARVPCAARADLNLNPKPTTSSIGFDALQSANVGPMVVTVEGSLDFQEGERLHRPVNIMQLYERSRTLRFWAQSDGGTLCCNGRSPWDQIGRSFLHDDNGNAGSLIYAVKCLRPTAPVCLASSRARPILRVNAVSAIALNALSGRSRAQAQLFCSVHLTVSGLPSTSPPVLNIQGINI